MYNIRFLITEYTDSDNLGSRKFKLFRRDSHHRECFCIYVCNNKKIMYQRPKSSSKRSFECEKTFKYQRNTENHLKTSFKTFPKRSNSLQNLNAVLYKEQKPIVKIAWANKISSNKCSQNEMKTTTRFQNTDNVGCSEFQKNNTILNSSNEDCKRKFTDIRIIVSRNYVKPVHHSSAKQTRTCTNTKEKTFVLPTWSKMSQNESSDTDDEIDFKNSNTFYGNQCISLVDNDFSKCELNIEIGEIGNENLKQNLYRNEKKVTFAAEVFEKKKLDAETRRLNFRNGHTKWNKNGILSRKEIENVGNSTSQNVFEFVHQFPTCMNSVSSNENIDNKMESINCDFDSQFKQTNLINKAKSLSVKRKLKSCRSRSFHRSLDNSCVTQSMDTYTLIKSLKPNQTEVVTMVSLLTSNKEQNNEIGATFSTENNAEIENDHCVLSNADNVNEIKSTDPLKLHEIQRKSGILKSFSHRNIQVSNYSEHESYFCETSSPLLKPLEALKMNKDKISSIIPVNTFHELVKNQKNDCISSVIYDDKNKAKCFEDHPITNTLQSQKEKECWSSFRKMTNKGLYVSFDTILRGLLTPTEYRLRKHELLGQE